MPTYYISWYIDTWGGHEWYDGGEDPTNDTSLHMVDAYSFSTANEAIETAKQLGTRLVLKSDRGLLPSDPIVWVLKDGEKKLDPYAVVLPKEV